MPDIQIKITNLPEIKAAFNRAPRLMRTELNDAIKKTIFTIEGKEVMEYRNLGIQVITRGLINSITRGMYFGDLKGEVGPNVTGSPGVNYAVYVHEGTRYMRGRPFLRNAVESSKLDVDHNFKTAVQNVLDAIGRSV